MAIYSNGQVGWKSGVVTPSISYLLDTYTGATAAYSLRKLRTAYTGNAITVRRSSDNTSTNIGFDANGNLDTTALLSFVGAGNGFVSTWFDQSGNGINTTQTTAVYQPQIVSAGSLLTINNKPCMRFDGVDDNFALSTPISYSAGVEFSSFHVEKKTSQSSNGIWITGGSSFYGGYTVVNVASALYMSSQINATTSNYSGGTLLGNPHRLISGFLRTNVADTKAYVNNTLFTFTDSGSEARASSFSVMGSRVGEHSNTQVQEFILYRSNQTSNRTGIESNINSFYSIY